MDGLGADGKIPGAVRLYFSGELDRRIESFARLLERCTLCPRLCGVNRLKGERGACGVGAELRVAAANVHPWEEPPISGTKGSGTIFFTGCPLRCLYCQNYPISQMGVGRTMTPEGLARRMVSLQSMGVHNINLVTPSHQIAGFLPALRSAIAQGLRLPLVYNTSGFERVEILQMLEGIVDIYLPDIKYSDSKVAARLSGCKDYVVVNRRALVEMWRQVGPLRKDDSGIAVKGMLVRHLVLPGDLAGTGDCLEFLEKSFGRKVPVSVMSQYFPAHRALSLPPLDRRLTPDEYGAALQKLRELGLETGFVQDEVESNGVR